MEQQYVKKKVTVKAVQWWGGNRREIDEFAGDNAFFTINEKPPMTLHINTSCGLCLIDMESWIIKDDSGQLYYCDNKKFRETYQQEK